MSHHQTWLDAAKNVLRTEADSILGQLESIDESFAAACDIILNTKGHLIVAGMGKSGHIGSKIAATFASTGTPAFFVHPAEAGHGDLGMITARDTLLALSYSGESDEIMTMMPIVQQMGVKVITITGNPNSSMAKQADIHLHLRIECEACPLGLAPTSSSTATLALGDALAVAMITARDFSSQDFARSHPFGRLGRRLITRVSDVMRSGEDIPLVSAQASVNEALFAITSKGLGATLIADDNTLLGIYTDGDLRRSLEHQPDALSHNIAEVMTRAPKTTTADTLAAEALQLMEQRKITTLPVTDAHNQICGILHIHDLLRAGVA